MNTTYFQPYYITSRPSSKQPSITNGIDDSIQQVYVLAPIVKPEIINHKTTIKPDHLHQQGQHLHKSITKSYQYQNFKATSAKIK